VTGTVLGTARGGYVPVELDPPGTPSWQGMAALRYDGRTGPPFPWAVVGADDLDALAHHSRLSIVEHWTEAGRCFARPGTG
jgi:hypothetical protein